jgi:predicted unusual protein kinase regulating ubiquinone biosynthesis (AarF/ABC1/UbiB family)
VPHDLALYSHTSHMNTKRNRQIRWYFLRTTLHIVWWDILLNRPGLHLLRKPAARRWQRLAREYRVLAQDRGGVLIKLGQFLSTRVDLLPAAVTDELVGLQDDVPPLPLEAVTAQIEADFQRPLADVFPWFSPEPVGSASLAQAHKARLASGETVVVKVLRPGIEGMVEADLQVISQAIQRLKFSKRIRQYVDLDRLVKEFVTVTRNEMDMAAEGHNAERFAQCFEADLQVYVPKIFWAYTAAHTLTMEDVAYLKIDDVAAIEATGIRCSDVAKWLFRIYMEQFFMTHLVHADPHAGNVFVKPLPDADESHLHGPDWAGFRPGDPVPPCPARPFQIAFVDFGMVVAIPERQRAALREYLIGVGTRDAHRIVKSYVAMGAVRPGTDLTRLEALTEATLEQFGDTLLGQFKDVNLDTFNRLLLQQYRDVTVGGTLQFPTDLLFVSRASGVLSGMIAKIDPNFNAWTEAAAFAERLLQDEWRDHWQDWLHNVADFTQLVFRLPRQFEAVLSQAQQGRLSVTSTQTTEFQNTVQKLQHTLNRQSWILAAIGLFMTGVIWHVGSRLVAVVAQKGQRDDDFGVWLMLLAAICFVLGMWKRA